jgi:hypothetical protein
VLDKIVSITGVETNDKGEVKYVRWWESSKGFGGRAYLHELAFQDQKYTKPFSENTINLVRLSDIQKREICGSDNYLELQESGSFAEGPEMSVIFAELLLRAKTSLSEERVSQIVAWPPQEVGWTLDMSIEAEDSGSGVPPEEYLASLRTQTARFVQADRNKPVLVLVPMNAQDPPHWSLLVLERKAKTVFPLEQTEEEAAQAETDRWQIRYYDSRDVISVDMYRRVHQAVKLVSLAFGLSKHLQWSSADEKAEQNLLDYGATGTSSKVSPGSVLLANRPRQRDGWSCGFWTLLFMEAELRRFLGEEPRALRKTSPNWEAEIRKHNKLIQNLQGFLQREKKKRDLAEQKKLLQAAHNKMLAKDKAEKEGKVDAEQDEDLPEPGEVITGGQSAGCSKCGGAKVGCLACVGWKAARYFRKAAKKEAAEEEKGKAAEKEAAEQKKAKAVASSAAIIHLGLKGSGPLRHFSDSRAPGARDSGN